MARSNARSLQVRPVQERMARFGQRRARHSPAGLAFGDLFAYALARLSELSLVYQAEVGAGPGGTRRHASSDLQSVETTGDDLEMLEMPLQPNARMPVPPHHERRDGTVYVLEGISCWGVDGSDV